jgi:1-deoxy-D-xylulose-5-phosphate reductoisomerase
MKFPIWFSLHYPKRIFFDKKELFENNFSLSFFLFKLKDFPLFKMILEAEKKNDNSLVILNACDETSVDYLLRGKIKFLHLYKAMDYIFSHYPSFKIKKIEEVFFWDDWARKKTKEYLDRLC